MAEGLSQPVMLNTPPGCDPSWWNNVWWAWEASREGRVEESVRLYEKADEFLDGCELNAGLSVLRHNEGLASGTVRPVPPTEDIVVTCYLPHKGGIGGEILADIPKDFEVSCSPESDRPHVMVLSTGRCGTVSLFRLFQGSNLEPYHTYWWMQHPYARWEFMCRLHAGSECSPEEWMSTRRAEWLGEKPMIGLNHSDTVYAPAFASAHPNSRFVYLRRNPEDVFGSFRGKGQWLDGINHFRPVLYDEDFAIRFPVISEVDGIQWHIEYTEAFCRAFGNIMGDRFIEVSADRLFGQDRDEIEKLLEFTGSGIAPDEAVEHFSVKVNEKAHKWAS